ncbi:helix-turn-helix domain-containing protein [Actinomadura roseirufa]|uniref:helix-turn-helix domain-containing protein n=1 Tax=Actinomadura roseirufa TaxID=2094049 RepID=UPI001041670F|nr:helix-turn-helix domain-containing protein [Actinomadura roseirufa]
MTCLQGLARLLAEQHTRADVSLRELEKLADKAGGTRLPRATCADILAGRRFPKKAVMRAFLRACQVSDDHLPHWERAWERVAIVQSRPVGTPDTTEPASTNPTEPLNREPPAPVPDQPPQRSNTETDGRPHVWRRIGLVIALVATAVTAGVLTSVLGAPEPARTRPSTGHRTPPPGCPVTDDGRAFGPGGSSRFTVTIDPANTGVRLTRRLDAGIATQTAAVTLGRTRAGVWQPLPVEPTYRWKDQSLDIAPSLTAHRRSLTITNTFVSSAEDFNEFAYYIDHKVNGVWTRADTVDIGPDHPTGEAAHHYRITGQTYAGTRLFDYPKHPNTPC